MGVTDNDTKGDEIPKGHGGAHWRIRGHARSWLQLNLVRMGLCLVSVDGEVMRWQNRTGKSRNPPATGEGNPNEFLDTVKVKGTHVECDVSN